MTAPHPRRPDDPRVTGIAGEFCLDCYSHIPTEPHHKDCAVGKTSRRPVAFTHDGVDYKAFPEQGSYYGAATWEGKRYLVQIAMNQDGSPDIQGGGVEVCNMGEQGDDVFLALLNAELGTAFRQSDFPGR